MIRGENAVAAHGQPLFSSSPIFHLLFCQFQHGFAAQPLHATAMGAGAGVARTARHIQPDDAVHSSERAGAARAGWTIGRDQRAAQGGGDVHWAGVVGDYQ